MSDTIIIHGDCLKELSQISDKSVDVVFYDPPYNIKKKYSGYDDNLTPEQYHSWMTAVYTESDRVSRNGVLIYVGGKLLKLFLNILPDSAHMVVVHKRAAGVFSGNYMLQYHVLLSTVRPVIKCKDLWEDVRLPGEGYFFREPRYEHPGLTGLALTEKILTYFTRDGDTVLDPFLGTGTTAVACKKLDRNSIGIEQSTTYIDIATNRLKALEEGVTFLG